MARRLFFWLEMAYGPAKLACIRRIMSSAGNPRTAGTSTSAHGETLHFLRQMDDGQGKKPAGTESPEKESTARGGIFCRRCGWHVTDQASRITVDGSHNHTFFNPAGLLFELSCFREAPGCSVHGAASADFSWFTGYLWRVALCGQCTAHLGWRFENRYTTFFSLIIPRLKESP
jgi:hypothetical protein